MKMNRTLLPETTLELIAEIDTPLYEILPNNTMRIRNVYEEDVTGYIVNGKGYSFKRFRSFNGVPYLLCSVSGKTTAISELQWKLLDLLPACTEQEAVDHFHAEATDEEVRLSYRQLWDFLKPLDKGRFELADLPNQQQAIDQFRSRVLLINTTEQCNIRCTYCYFSGNYEQTRVHRPIKNRFADVKPIIDQFMAYHHEERAQRAIYFFGGEPLLNFQLIKEILIYIRELATERDLDVSNLIFQIATNGLLLNETNIKTLIDHNVYLNVSMDGPNHDLYRVDAMGNGTLDKVSAKLEWLCDNYTEYYRYYVGIVCVVSPPYQMSELYRFFTNWQPAQEALHLDLDLILLGNDAVRLAEEMQSLHESKRQLWQLFVQTHALSEEQKRNSWLYFFTTGFNFLHRAFSRALWRGQKPVTDGKIENINGIRALPGLFITCVGANGKLYATYEYQSEIFEIGTVQDGFDTEKIEEIASNFREVNNRGTCGTCWAARLCQVSYADFYVSHLDEPDVVTRKLKAKHQRCLVERFDLENALVAIETIRENYGEQALAYMKQEHRMVQETFGAKR